MKEAENFYVAWNERIKKFAKGRPFTDCGNNAVINALLAVKDMTANGQEVFMLNAGSGHGGHSKMFEEQGFKVVNVDTELYDEVDQYQDDLHFMQISDKAVDVVLCSHTLEHVLSPVVVLDEFHRVLKDGGKLLIVGPRYEQNWIDTDGHYYVFTKEQLFSILNQIGFEVTQYMDYAGDASFFLLAVKR